MEIIEEIVKWASGQPRWQQLMMAELLSGKVLSDSDYRFYANEALEEAKDTTAYAKKVGNPLKDFTYENGESSKQVSITEIQATQNINAISDGSSLPFDKVGLNLIYGDNASGKSGFTRILKNACNCRHKEELKGDVHSGHDRECIANIIYDASGTTEKHQLDNSSAPNTHLKTVHVFDSKSGRNYLISENELVFMPAGVDVLDSLSSGIERVGEILKHDLQDKTNALNRLEPSFQEFYGTDAYELIGALSDPSALDDLKALKLITLDEHEEILKLQKDTVLRQTKSPQRIREEREKLYRRLSDLRNKLTALKEALRDDNVDKIIVARDNARIKLQLAKEAGRKKFENENYIDGTGDDLWKNLWDAAQEFSEKSAYPGHDFPHSESEAKCVLCQQKIHEPAKLKFDEFVEYVSDKSQAEANLAERELNDLKDNFVRANLIDSVFNELSDAFTDEDYPHIEDLIAAIKQARDVHKTYFEKYAISSNADIDYIDTKTFSIELGKLDDAVNALEQEINVPLNDAEFRRALQIDLDRLKSLRSKNALNTHEKEILENIEIHAEKKTIDIAIGSSNTFAVSTKIGDVSKRLIIDKLATSFNDELDEIFLGKITAELRKGRTIKGVPSSVIVLSGKSGDFQGNSIEEIMSEGEQRGVALAGFFAELTIAPSKSAIIFDDPVTSMDHRNIERIARRIAKESLTRQVIVFTHNVLFASELERAVIEISGSVKTRSIEKLSKPGVVRDRLPFDTMKTTERIDDLEKRINPLKIKFENNEEDYKSESESFYKDLRKTWERAIEEVLLNGVVIRYRRDVQPKRVDGVFLNEDDKSVIAGAMHNCSKFMHDSAEEAGSNEIAEPKNLNEDLDILKEWIKDVKSRSKSTNSSK